MKGIILGFDTSKEEGKIRGEDDIRYRFVQSDFNAGQLPEPGIEVDFEIDDGMAKDIYVIQKAKPQNANLQGMQVKAANAIGDISNNADVIRAKGAVISGFSNAPAAIVALLVYAVATFLPFASASDGWFGTHISLIDMDIGKAMLVLSVVLLGVILSDIAWVKRPLKILSALALLISPFIAFMVAISSHGSFRYAFHGSFDAQGSFQIGCYLLVISAFVLLFSPIKNPGAEK